MLDDLDEGARIGLWTALGVVALLLFGLFGDPTMNADLARERSKNVREALKVAGVAPARIALRRPESTTGDGTNREARRVEVRLMP